MMVVYQCVILVLSATTQTVSLATRHTLAKMGSYLEIISISLTVLFSFPGMFSTESR